MLLSIRPSPVLGRQDGICSTGASLYGRLCSISFMWQQMRWCGRGGDFGERRFSLRFFNFPSPLFPPACHVTAVCAASGVLPDGGDKPRWWMMGGDNRFCGSSQPPAGHGFPLAETGFGAGRTAADGEVVLRQLPAVTAAHRLSLKQRQCKEVSLYLRSCCQ